MNKSSSDNACKLAYVEKSKTIITLSSFIILILIFILFISGTITVLSALLLCVVSVIIIIILLVILYLVKKDFSNQLEIHNLRIIRHDFSKHLGIIKGMVAIKEFEQLCNYVESLSSELAFSGELLKLGCPALSILLNCKEHLAIKNDIVFKVETKATLYDIHVSPTELCIIIGNLIDNAIEASMEIDSVKRYLYIEIGLHNEENRRFYYFKIVNCGKPIPEIVLKKIFAPNYSTKGKGRGMGLYIVSKTLQKYNGSINVICNNESTCFNVFIPCKVPH